MEFGDQATNDANIQMATAYDFYFVQLVDKNSTSTATFAKRNK